MCKNKTNISILEALRNTENIFEILENKRKCGVSHINFSKNKYMQYSLIDCGIVSLHLRKELHISNR